MKRIALFIYLLSQISFSQSSEELLNKYRSNTNTNNEKTNQVNNKPKETKPKKGNPPTKIVKKSQTVNPKTKIDY